MPQGRRHPCLPLFWGDAPVIPAQLHVLSAEIIKSMRLSSGHRRKATCDFSESEARLDLVSAFYVPGALTICSPEGRAEEQGVHKFPPPLPHPGPRDHIALAQEES